MRRILLTLETLSQYRGVPRIRVSRRTLSRPATARWTSRTNSCSPILTVKLSRKRPLRKSWPMSFWSSRCRLRRSSRLSGKTEITSQATIVIRLRVEQALIRSWARIAHRRIRYWLSMTMPSVLSARSVCSSSTNSSATRPTVASWHLKWFKTASKSLAQLTS